MANLGIDFSTNVLLANYNYWAVDVTFTPMIGTAYQGRGIFDTRALDVQAEDGSLFSDQETILDLREAEFTTLPKQGDRVTIPRDGQGVNQGTWEITDASTNGGGETTLVLKRYVP